MDRSRNSLPVCVPGIITSSPSQNPAQTDVKIVETPGKNHYIVGTAHGVDQKGRYAYAYHKETLLRVVSHKIYFSKPCSRTIIVRVKENRCS